MTESGQHRGKHERENDQDDIEDLQPRQDESAELTGGSWDGSVGGSLHSKSQS